VLQIVIISGLGQASESMTRTSTLILNAVDAIDALVDSGRIDDGDELARAAERLFDIEGALATARSLNLDRHWRNVRTASTHNALAYKAHAAGNYVVNGCGRRPTATSEPRV
jgi:hypothetical protein